MQFLGSTWAQYGVDAEGAGVPDRWNPADAIYAAANYLRASGAPQNYEAAIYAYNHASWYVRRGPVLGRALPQLWFLARGRAKPLSRGGWARTANPVRWAEQGDVSARASAAAY